MRPAISLLLELLFIVIIIKHLVTQYLSVENKLTKSPRQSVTEILKRCVIKLQQKEAEHERSSVNWCGRLFQTTGAALWKARPAIVIRWLLR